MSERGVMVTVRSPGVVVGVSPGRMISYWSAAAADFYGLDANAVIGRHVEDVLAWAGSAPGIRGFLVPGDVRVFWHRASDRHGRLHWLQTTLTVTRDRRGLTERLYASVPAEDISSPAGTACASSPRPLRGIDDLVSLCSNRMALVYTPPGLRRLMGHDPRDILGRPSLEFVHPDDRGTWEATWQKALRQPYQRHRVEVRWQNTRGHWIYMATELENRLSDHTLTAVAVRTLDFGDSLAAHVARDEAEAALRTVLGFMSEGVWVVNARGRTIFASHTLGRLLDISPEQLSGLALDEVLDAGAAQSILSLPVGAQSSLRLPATTGCGNTLKVHVDVIPRADGAGQPDGAILLWRQAAPASDGPEHRGPSGWARRLDQARLTKREREVVRLLLRGDRVPAIADLLGTGQSTVRNQLSSVFRKLAVRSQQELIEALRG
jgi:PAS domain S-box-containing protein